MRRNLHAVVVHINIDFTAYHKIVTMNQGIDQGFDYCPLSVVRFVYTLGGSFCESNFGVVLYKIAAAVQQIHEAAAIFFVVQGIIKDRAFFESVPPCTEQAKRVNGVLVGQQRSRPSEMPFFINEAERTVVAVFKTDTCSLPVCSFQKEFADRIGVESITVYKWEVGSMNPSLHTAAKIAIALKTSVAYLIGETNNPSPITLAALDRDRERVFFNPDDLDFGDPEKEFALDKYGVGRRTLE